MREAWTDERLDDLNGNIEKGFERLDVDLRAQRTEARSDFASLRSEMRSEFGSVRAGTSSEFTSLRGETRSEFASLRGEMNDRFDRMEARFDGLQRTMILSNAGIITALIGLIVTQV